MFLIKNISKVYDSVIGTLLFYWLCTCFFVWCIIFSFFFCFFFSVREFFFYSNVSFFSRLSVLSANLINSFLLNDVVVFHRSFFFLIRLEFTVFGLFVEKWRIWKSGRALSGQVASFIFAGLFSKLDTRRNLKIGQRSRRG